MKFKLLLFTFLALLLIAPSSLAVEYNVSIDITPKEIDVRPCGIATYDIDVENLGELEDTYSILVDGFPEDWYTLTHESITLEAGESEKAYLFVTPDCYEKFELHYDASVSAIGMSEDTVNFTMDVVPDHVIEIAMPEEVRVCLGEEIEATITVWNPGNHTEEMIFKATGPATDFVELPEAFTIDPDEMKNITVTFKPVDIELGSYDLELEAQSTTSYARSSVSSVVRVVKCYDVEVTYPEEVSACAGRPETFRLTVENTGVKNDTYEIRVEDLDFSATVSLGPGESRTFEIEFLKEEEGTYEISFVVESPYVKRKGMITFTVTVCYGVDLTVEEKEIEIESGRGKLIKGKVKNIGLMADTFKIISDVIWSSIRPEEVTLSSNESEDVYAYYSPEYGAKGTYYTNLTAKSDYSEDIEELTIEVLPKEEVPVEIPPVNVTTTTTIEETTTIPVVPVENVTTTVAPNITIPGIPTAEVVGIFERIWESRLLRSLLIAVIIVIIILIVIYLIVMR